VCPDARDSINLKKFSELMLVEAIRRYVESLPADQAR
jgi:hypothetical protein